MIVKLAQVLVFVVAVASILLNANQAEAQGGIALENVGATYRFGEQVLFSATIKSSTPIQSASIIIFDEGHGDMHTSPLAMNPDGSMQFIFDARQNSLRPFTFVRWRYEFALADGGTFKSESYSVRYDDNRYDWQRLESGVLRVMWFQGDATLAQNAMNAALAGLQSINQLFPVDLAEPVDIFIYPAKNDLPSIGGEPWVVGLAEPSVGVALAVIEPGANQSLEAERRIPHELMHVMTYRNIGAGYNNVPAWLREGLATLVEINPTANYDRVLMDASARDALIPLLELCASFPSQADSAFLAYAESRSFTTYLRDMFGASALIELARRYADGVTCEHGVELVYSTSFAQLELRWRESALGENTVSAALRNMLPYLILLCLVLFMPLFIGFNAMRKKSKK